MKNIIKIALCIALFAFTSTEAGAQNLKTKVYMYGFCASFNDSTVYFTDIQEVEEAYVGKKTHFLYGRDSYSYQLKQHMQALGLKTPTCMVGFADKRDKAEKKYMKLRQRYTKVPGKYDVKFIAATDFQFEGITATEEDEPAQKPKAVKNKKQKKNKKK